MTLIDLLKKAAAEHPLKPAILYKEGSCSYESLNKMVAAIGRYLVGTGIRKGDKVLFLVNKKSPEFIASFLGVAATGAVAVPMDCNQPRGYFNGLLKQIAPRAVILSAALTEFYSSTQLRLPSARVLVMGETAGSPHNSLEAVARAGRTSHFPEVPLKKEDTLYFNLTSGTTGRPKCAVSTHENILCNTRCAVRQLDLTEDDVHLCMFPASTHPHELFARALFLGGTMALTNTIAPKSLTETIESFGVTCMMAIAPIYASLVRCHGKTGFGFTSLRLAESGGMHLDPVTARSFLKRFGFSIIPVWGSTETAGIALAMPLEEKNKQGSCGTVLNGYEARLVDEAGLDVSLGSVGEMIIRGRGVCPGYYKNDGETRANFKKGWYRTGDMFKQDSDGYFYFAGRKNGMMKVAGMKVFPVEIEDHLIEHPNIKEVGVTKVNNNPHGEIPKAVIVLEPGEKMDKKEVRSFLSRKLAAYKIPKIIEFTDALPRTPGGKPLMNKL